MEEHQLVIIVYGREQTCASCVGASGSFATYEWLQAAIGRKYNDIPFTSEYVDMDKDNEVTWHVSMIERIEKEELFYPLVLLNDEIIAEGIPYLKAIYQAIEAKIS